MSQYDMVRVDQLQPTETVDMIFYTLDTLQRQCNEFSTGVKELPTPFHQLLDGKPYFYVQVELPPSIYKITSRPMTSTN